MKLFNRLLAFLMQRIVVFCTSTTRTSELSVHLAPFEQCVCMQTIITIGVNRDVNSSSAHACTGSPWRHKRGVFTGTSFREVWLAYDFNLNLIQCGRCTFQYQRSVFVVYKELRSARKYFEIPALGGGPSRDEQSTATIFSRSLCCNLWEECDK